MDPTIQAVGNLKHLVPAVTRLDQIKVMTGILGDPPLNAAWTLEPREYRAGHLGLVA